MILKTDEIIEGWANNMKDKFHMLNPEVKSLAVLRMNLCNICNMRVNNWCSPLRTGTHIETGLPTKGCGCNLSAKTMSKKSKCPLGKW